MLGLFHTVMVRGSASAATRAGSKPLRAGKGATLASNHCSTWTLASGIGVASSANTVGVTNTTTRANNMDTFVYPIVLFFYFCFIKKLKKKIFIVFFCVNDLTRRWPWAYIVLQESENVKSFILFAIIICGYPFLFLPIVSLNFFFVTFFGIYLLLQSFEAIFERVFLSYD